MDVPVRLRIVHVVRAPIGGIFRHVCDLATAQSAAGHTVGIVCDSRTGGAFEAAAVAAVAGKLALGATRLPMRRDVSPADLAALMRLTRHIAGLAPDVIHCHGAKGGVYGRLIGARIGRTRPLAVLYAPHGGSLHYAANSLEGRFYFAIERGLERLTDALVHVSAYEAETYRQKIGPPRCRAVVIHNGLREEEFDPVIPHEDARDLLFLGMYRDLKGTDVFLEAIARLESRFGRRASAHLFGQSEDEGRARYQALAERLGIAARVTFHDPAPIREAFAFGRAVVVPSRAESMPYIVLETIAAGLPIVATRVGGIPEIFGPRAGELVPPGDPDALALALDALLADPVRAQLDAAARLDWLRPRFHIDAMQRRVDELYREILASKTAAHRSPLRQARATESRVGEPTARSVLGLVPARAPGPAPAA
ncbi:glycosyltransferase family 4 protein [Rhodoplanes sp. TEM]|uniref:Glycosyltransferase family 4 protein n=1 Tax=Rhodoplanes tepidamans TaxID=200616 RepID=A0ABT5JIA3_RHOTP|nr:MULTISPECIES: glycosyltransferase family 4 protein [Rhodoplanes]MDC7789451.1 glycosyltransferase family 4 protein [Rhodoplanes tepidamans]MDC7985412.1 glycosyltransferase family 4 protein [Rhodoplanes sp. TEM]MDQ0353626.1 glycosyltransferase involved in cell wall biosynthesis [Rhodoplanes tepidamans]